MVDTIAKLNESLNAVAYSSSPVYRGDSHGANCRDARRQIGVALRKKLIDEKQAAEYRKLAR